MDMDQIFCSSQIVIPPLLPSILKKFSKAAIRTQPYDLLVWSAAYFRAMSVGELPPIKARLEFPFPENRQLTLGYVKLLVYQFGKNGEVSRDDLSQKWNDVCLPESILYNILRLGSFAHVIEWDKFIAITIGFLEDNLKETMLRICEVMTEEPEGGSAMVPYQFFISLYQYLGEMDCGEARVQLVSKATPTEEKKPCLPDAKESDSISGKDIDSVIREIGDVESTASIETRLEGDGMEFDWPNLESRSESDLSELRAHSEPSDEGATSRYGFEVMAETGEDQGDEIGGVPSTIKKVGEEAMKRDDKALQKKEIGEIKVLYETRRRAQHSDKDSEVSDDFNMELGDNPRTEFLQGATTLTEVIPTTDKKQRDADMDQALQKVDLGEESVVESESEEGSVRTIIGQREEDDFSPSEKDSQISDNKKALMPLEEKGFEKSASLLDLRPTMDRELRRKMMDGALLGEEKRKAEELKAAAEAAEKQRIEDEAKEKYHMHVPGIGPRLPQDLMETFQQYMECCALRQEGMVMPRNIRHFLCPPIDLESLERAQHLVDLLEVATQIPEEKPAIESVPGLLEIIRPISGLEFDSTAESITSDSSPSIIAFKEISSLSEQEQIVAPTLSLTFLLNQEKQ